MKIGSIIVFSGLILTGLLTVSWVYAEIDPATVVAVWLLDEGQGKTAGDLSENANDGNITGSEWVDGKFGKALEFDGGTDQVEVPDAEGLDAIPQITVVTWVKYDKEPPQNYAPVGKEPLYRFIIGKGGSGHFVAATTGNAWYSAGTVASWGGITPGEWHHLAGTYDGVLIKFYIDGKFAGEGPQEVSGDVLNNAAGFTMAKSIANNVDFLEGIVDEVAIFSVALSEADIKSIMMNGLEKVLAGDVSVQPTGKLNAAWAAIKAQH